MTQSVFNRYEKKYILPREVYGELRCLLEPHMQQDGYGRHTICNIYYDTAGDLLIRRSVARPVYKEKLRLRSYGQPGLQSRVFLEIKKKYRGVVNKRRVALELRQAYDYLAGRSRPLLPSGREQQILRELDFFLARYPLQPRLCLCYDRIALFGREDGDFRVTFDSRIRCRRQRLQLELGDGGSLLLPENWVLMEAKFTGACPLWFSHLLARLGLYPVSFSKYGAFYRQEQGGLSPADLLAGRVESCRAALTGREEAC